VEASKVSAWDHEMEQLLHLCVTVLWDYSVTFSNTKYTWLLIKYICLYCTLVMHCKEYIIWINLFYVMAYADNHVTLLKSASEQWWLAVFPVGLQTEGRLSELFYVMCIYVVLYTQLCVVLCLCIMNISYRWICLGITSFFVQLHFFLSDASLFLSGLVFCVFCICCLFYLGFLVSVSLLLQV